RTRDADGGRGPPGPRRPGGSDQADRRATRSPPRGPANLGQACRDRHRAARRHHEHGCRTDSRAGAREQGIAPGQRDPEVRLGFLRRGAGPPTALKVAYIDQYKDEFGVQPICDALKETDAEIAPSTYYAAASRPPSARSLRDAHLSEEIRVLHAANYGVYGARKIHAALRRAGRQVARRTVERLMREAGLRGVSRAKSPRTTKPAPETGRPADLVKRQFTADAPNCLWVADITYIRTFSGWVYAAFVIDVFSRMVVGWQVATSLYTDLALDALEMGLWRRRREGADLAGLIHHSDRGV